MESLYVVKHIGPSAVQSWVFHVMSSLPFQHTEEALTCSTIHTVPYGTHRTDQCLLFEEVDFPGFARHQIALKCNSMRGVYERQTVYR